MNKLTSLSIIISVYNEQDVVGLFWNQLNRVISGIKGVSFEIIFVNDGSSDNSMQLLNEIVQNKAHSDIEFVLIDFSKNFGHESAMIAGIDSSTKEAIMCLDADLQHPPEKIPELIESFNEGFEIVTMIRSKREDNGLLKNALSKSFYRFLNFVSDYNFDKNASDFFLISSRVSTILKENFRERNRFLRGYIQTIGFSKKSLFYDAPSRAGGESSYSLFKLMKLSFTALFSFSNKPLQISLFISFIFAFFTISFMLFSLWVYFFGETPPSGYTTLIIFQSSCFTMLFLLIGILSIYFGKTIDEMRKRPIYLIKNLMKKNVKSTQDNIETH